MAAPQELDRIQGRGQSGAKSPLLWEEGQVEALLQGSPIVAEVAERLHVRPKSLLKTNPQFPLPGQPAMGTWWCHDDFMSCSCKCAQGCQGVISTASPRQMRA